jgi:hypothetical protein
LTKASSISLSRSVIFKLFLIYRDIVIHSNIKLKIDYSCIISYPATAPKVE